MPAWTAPSLSRSDSALRVCARQDSLDTGNRPAHPRTAPAEFP